VVLGPVVVYHTLRSAASPALVKWGGAGIQCVSLLWFNRIVVRPARVPGGARTHGGAAAPADAPRLRAGRRAQGGARAGGEEGPVASCGLGSGRPRPHSMRELCGQRGSAVLRWCGAMHVYYLYTMCFSCM